MQTTSVPKSEQENLIGAFWALLRQSEEDARSSGNGLDKHMVEANYKLWNRITGDSKVPHWLQEKVKEAREALKEYHLNWWATGYYLSTRCTKEWRETSNSKETS
jgi:uncharacterized membrane-anchored protein YjiN (DUF445 family)